MQRIIAVEEGLTPYRQYLADRGYQVVDMDHDSIRRADAVVIGGMDDRFMGIADIETEKRVIMARGLTPPEVEDRIRYLERVRYMGPDNDGQGR